MSTSPQENVSQKVVRAVAQEKGMSETEIPPLYEAIDPDALNTLFKQSRQGQLSFDYSGYVVTVWNDGDVLLQPQLENAQQKV